MVVVSRRVWSLKHGGDDGGFVTLAIRRLCSCCTTVVPRQDMGAVRRYRQGAWGWVGSPWREMRCAAVLQGTLLESVAVVKGSELHNWAREVRNGGVG